MQNLVKTVLPFKNLPIAGRELNWDSQGATRRVREWATSNGEVDFGKFAQAFLWVDAENRENLTAYKLPVADVINGQLQVVPRAVYAVAGVLNGARGGVDVPQEDIARLKNIVARYYSAISQKFEDDSIQAPFEKIKKEYISLFKALVEEKRLVYGVVLEPDEEDLQGDTITTDEIEKASHFFMEKSGIIGDKHMKVAKAKVVESYIAPISFMFEGSEDLIKKGSWVLVTKIYDDNIWRGIKSGEYTGYSIGAYGTREAEE